MVSSAFVGELKNAHLFLLIYSDSCIIPCWSSTGEIKYFWE